MNSNRVPMTDVCYLISENLQEAAGGYKTAGTPVRKQVFCSIISGVARTEFYEAAKAGIQLGATAEIWEGDYSGQTLLEHETHQYRIERVYPNGSGLLQLSLREVTRG